jgi:hypothetical protein
MTAPLPLRAKFVLAGRIWLSFLRVRVLLERKSLPRLAQDLASMNAARKRTAYHPQTLSRGIHLVLRIGRRRPTCLLASLVLMDLLRRQGDQAELLIGLPPKARNHHAHAWVELDGNEIGPPPGRLGHAEMARFG